MINFLLFLSKINLPNCEMEFENKVIILTGASSGIGEKLTEKIASKNCKLALLARSIDKLEELSQKVKRKENEILPVQCDVSDKESCRNAFEVITKKFGKVDIAILNAGISYRTGVEDFNSAEAENIFAVNVLGIVYWIELLLPQFKERKEGIIVGTSSLADGRGFPKSGFYCGSKAAATLILESLRIELEKFNVKVITVKPGFVKTPMTDKNEFEMPLLMSAEKAAEIIYEGLKKEKRIIQFPLPTVIGAKILKILPDSLLKLSLS